MSSKILQVPVIVGFGEQEFFIDRDIRISPPSPPVFMVKDIKKWVDVYTTKISHGKIIFNAYLWKDINYTTVEDVHYDTVNGPVYHSTTRIPFAGFVDVKPLPGEELCEEDTAEVLEACVEGEKDIWHVPDKLHGVTVYQKLHDKTVVRLKFKVTRVQHVKVPCEP